MNQMNVNTREKQFSTKRKIFISVNQHHEQKLFVKVSTKSNTVSSCPLEADDDILTSSTT